MSAGDLAALEGTLGRLGLALWGYADVAGLFRGPWGEFPRAVSIARALPEGALDGVLPGGPTAPYYAAYHATNAALNAAASEVAAAIAALGYRALAFPATVSSAELHAHLSADLAAPVQHKTVATRAGLGWIGRSAVLVTREYGPRVRLASVFTDMPLPVAEPITASRCGECRRCVEACPAAAITGERWQVGVPREALVDAAACQRTAERLLAERVGADNAVCGVCLAACPFGRPREARA